MDFMGNAEMNIYFFRPSRAITTTQEIIMKKVAHCITLVFLVGFVFSGCASIIYGSTQKVTIDSNVQGADILINNKHVGTTPFTGTISRGNETTLTIAKEGFRPKTITMNTSIEPIFFGNIICGGTTGSITDFATDAMYKYSPNTIQVDLVQE
jgi:hypothetical protein